jgi:putative transcriptional regulator
MIDLKPGDVLIAEPFLKDPNFSRAVILLCEHEEAKGSLGFVLNREIPYTISDLISDLPNCDFPVFFGGPVQLDTLHFLHTRPDVIEDSFKISEGLHWGGNFTQVIKLIKQGLITHADIKFYVGYSGWNSGQLAGELNDNSWFTTTVTKKLVFVNQAAKLWQESIKQLGPEYMEMVNYPIDPNLN